MVTSCGLELSGAISTAGAVTASLSTPPASRLPQAHRRLVAHAAVEGEVGQQLHHPQPVAVPTEGGETAAPVKPISVEPPGCAAPASAAERLTPTNSSAKRHSSSEMPHGKAFHLSTRLPKTTPAAAAGPRARRSERWVRRNRAPPAAAGARRAAGAPPPAPRSCSLRWGWTGSSVAPVTVSCASRSWRVARALRDGAELVGDRGVEPSVADEERALGLRTCVACGAPADEVEQVKGAARRRRGARQPESGRAIGEQGKKHRVALESHRAGSRPGIYRQCRTRLDREHQPPSGEGTVRYAPV